MSTMTATSIIALPRSESFRFMRSVPHVDDGRNRLDDIGRGILGILGIALFQRQRHDGLLRKSGGVKFSPWKVPRRHVDGQALDVATDDAFGSPVERSVDVVPGLDFLD